jgi:hypothetical protein
MVRGRAMRATKAARIFTHDAGLFGNNKIDGEGTCGTFGDKFFSFSQKKTWIGKRYWVLLEMLEYSFK